jgi:hypothetical protein
MEPEQSVEYYQQEFKGRKKIMSLSKPSKLPRWANDGGTIEEPTEGKKNIGFIAEKPTFGLFNWILNLIYQWLDYFEKTASTQEDGVISGAAKTSGFPLFLSAGVSTRRFSILGDTTPLVLQIDGTRYELDADLTLGADLSLAPSSNNTGTVGEGDGSASTCYRGEYGGRISLSGVPGSNIEAAEAVIQAYKITNGANSEYCLGRYTTTQVADPGYHLMPIIRGIGGTDRQPLTNASTTITILAAHWIFLNKDMATIKTTANYPTWAATAPAGPATDDFWYNTVLKSWARWSGSAWVYENYVYLGYAICDSANCVAVECVDFVGIAWDETMHYKKMQGDRLDDDNIRIVGPGEINVAGNLIHLGLDTVIDGGIAESGNGGGPWYYIYLKPDGTIINSPKGPRKKDFRKGWYHPSEYWRCIGLYSRTMGGITYCHYEPESGFLLMQYHPDILNGEPGIYNYNLLTNEAEDGADYPNIPPIVCDFHIRLKAYATAGTVPNDIFLRPALDSFLTHGYIPVHTVGTLNVMETSFAHAMIEDCLINVAYFGNSATDPLSYTTLLLTFCSGRIKF